MCPKSEEYNVNVHIGKVGHWCLSWSLEVNWTSMLEWLYGMAYLTYVLKTWPPRFITPLIPISACYYLELHSAIMSYSID